MFCKIGLYSVESRYNALAVRSIIRLCKAVSRVKLIPHSASALSADNFVRCEIRHGELKSIVRAGYHGDSRNIHAVLPLNVWTFSL